MAEKKENKENIDFFPIIGKYDKNSIKIEDRGLEKYIILDSKDLFIGAPHANKLFGKSKISIVERLINNLMRTEAYTGKKGEYVTIQQTVEGCERIISGELDKTSEQELYMIGALEKVKSKFL